MVLAYIILSITAAAIVAGAGYIAYIIVGERAADRRRRAFTRELPYTLAQAGLSEGEQQAILAQYRRQHTRAQP